MRAYLAVAGILLAGLITVAVTLGIEVGVHLAFGWVLFLYRVLPSISPDWPTVAVGIGAFLLFAVGVHLWGITWARQGTERKWKLRTTCSIVTMVVFLFAAGVSIIGIVHQTGWLIRSPEPLRSHGLSHHPYRNENNMKMIAMGVMNCESAFGHLPEGGTYSPDGTVLHGWVTKQLPYGLYSSNSINMFKPWNDPVNRIPFQCILPEFINTEMRGAPLFDAEGYGLTHYAANVHVMGPGRGLSDKEFTDGRSNTLLIGEVNNGFRPWASPFNWRDPANGIQGGSQGFGGPTGSRGVNFVMADGSIRFLRASTDPGVVKALGTPAGGESVPNE